ncbi:Ribosome biogenesis GTPase A [bioreactor metagenome]|uniref:Ribosome biogenesis GTPase A n=1 Tax=bioreactor metagenome TaxID=1076179 RepID=A0A645ABA7_9ZZZZ
MENRPGVTLQTQWIRLEEDLELLDTPGILWPKFEDKTVGYHLACTGAIKDTILDTIDIASFLAAKLAKQYSELLKQRYKIEIIPGSTGFEIIEQIARKRGFLLSGGEVDTERAANMLLLEFRTFKIGPITLEHPDSSGEVI